MPPKKAAAADKTQEELESSSEEEVSEGEDDREELEGKVENLSEIAYFMKSSRSVSSGFYVDITTEEEEVRSLTIKGRAPGPFGSKTEGDHSFAIGGLERFFTRVLRGVIVGSGDYLSDVKKHRIHIYDIISAIGAILADDVRRDYYEGLHYFRKL